MEKENGIGLERIVFFSDAVFAIAITLLVLDIRLPEMPEGLVAQRLPQELASLWPKYLSYVLSFLVITMYWMGHHGIFSHIRGYDRTLIWLNALFLMCIAFLPFPTSLLGEYGDHRLAVVIYAGSLAVARLLLTTVWWYATADRRLVAGDLSGATIRAHRVRGLAMPAVFLLSIAISFFSVSAAMYSWALLVVADLLVMRAMHRRGW
ncbi:DUF1211 domain-containing membrane protein [Rubrobacter xylanophilus]|uniref:DUF1211 domain-containing membrane protein n=1 Tax=Rubrobacter xylanophilus TaxID=49319 RepID=A0A510HJW6_9ACTN|nr:TMEM175 family protein [Rubrobacter xylanophilus]BBL80188.1 DUF1211 domain-containing membrane protein [Rubrobacter xylanophilus]